MEVVMVAAYKPYKGKEDEFRSLFFGQVNVFREEGLLSDRHPWFMRSADGTYLCFFEWKSKEGIEQIGNNPRVQHIWMQFEKVCAFQKPAVVSEFQEMFGQLESLKP